VQRRRTSEEDVGIVLGKGEVREIREREPVNEMKSTRRAQENKMKEDRMLKRLGD